MSKKHIESPVKGFSGLVAGVHFVDGKGSTDSESAIAYFERQGYTVSGAKPEERGYPAGDPSDKWKVEELKAYAAERNIDLGEAKKKDEIWAALQPGGTPYKGQTMPEGQALVNDASDPTDTTVKDQADLPVK